MRIKTLLFVSLLLALLPSCGTKEEYGTKKDDRTLSVSRDVLEFPSSGGSQTIEVSSNSEWYAKTVKDAYNWISLSPADGKGNGSVTVTLGRNPSPDAIESKFFVAVFNGKLCTVTIRQEAGDGLSVVSSDHPYDIDLLYFNNEASIHEIPTVERFLKYMCSKEEKPRWLFDGYILSALNNKAGHSFAGCSELSKAANKDEWLELIEYHCAKTIPLLDQATVQTAELTGVYPHRTKVIFTIPFPSYGHQDWGSVDGTALDFRNEADRLKACLWFIDEAFDRFSAGKFKNVELVGFYWLNEDLGMSTHSRITQNLINEVAHHIHCYGTEFYWIPYNDIHLYSDARVEKWKEYGFDRVIYQPNYFFRPTWDFSRLETAINKAHSAGVGLEFECDWHGTTNYYEKDRADYNRRAKETISEFDRLGVWENDIIAYYEYHAFEYISDHPESPLDRELYGMLSTRIAERQRRFYNIEYPSQL